MRSTRMLRGIFVEKPGSTTLGLTAAMLGVAAYSGYRAYQDYNQRTNYAKFVVYMKEVRSKLYHSKNVLDDILEESRKMTDLDSYVEFWRHVYLNQYSAELKHPADYALILTEIARFIEHYQWLHSREFGFSCVDKKDEEKIRANNQAIYSDCVKALNDAYALIIPITNTKKLHSLPDLTELFLALGMSDNQARHERRETFSNFREGKVPLPFADLQQIVMKYLHSQSIAILFVKHDEMFDFLNCQFISSAAKQELLNHNGILEVYVRELQTADDLKCLLQYSSDASLSLVTKRLCRDPDRVIMQKLAGSLNAMSEQDFMALLDLWVDHKDYANQRIGLYQRQFLEALVAGNIKPDLRSKLNELITSGRLAQDAAFFVQTLNPVGTGFPLFSLKKTEEQQAVAASITYKQ